jgi:hypothetical protein
MSAVLISISLVCNGSAGNLNYHTNLEASPAQAPAPVRSAPNHGHPKVFPPSRLLPHRRLVL